MLHYKHGCLKGRGFPSGIETKAWKMGYTQIVGLKGRGFPSGIETACSSSASSWRKASERARLPVWD